MTTTQTGTLYIIAGPSGSGKTSLITDLVKRMPDLAVSISHTTRPQRPQEKDGVDYYFVNEETFLQMIEAGEFLEYAKVFNYHYYYGTSQQWVETRLLQGTDIILEIDWQGAMQVRRLYPEAVGIFILPPSREALDSRLRHRQGDLPEIIQKRLDVAVAEMSHYAEFDYFIINRDFETAISDLQAIIIAQNLTFSKQVQKQAALIASLLA
ncbi:MAG: gmk [Gammaproteobacteria bacterium]|jgi:guanylate kinase|nr:gmk [Gammaproteobacteria bacterium]